MNERPKHHVVEAEPRDESVERYIKRLSRPGLPRAGIKYDSRVGEIGDQLVIGGEKWQVVNEAGTILAPDEISD